MTGTMTGRVDAELAITSIKAPRTRGATVPARPAAL
jgi:hypothetical protein